MIPVEVTVSGGIPADVAVRLRELTLTAAVWILTVTDLLAACPGRSPDRGAIAGKGKMVRIDQAPGDRNVQELLQEELKERVKRAV